MKKGNVRMKIVASVWTLGGALDDLAMKYPYTSLVCGVTLAWQLDILTLFPYLFAGAS